MDFGSIAKKAQDALAQHSDTIGAAVDKAGAFAKDKFPDRAAQIDQAVDRTKGVVPGAGLDTPPDPTATPEVDRTAAAAADVHTDQPSSAGYAPPAPSTSPTTSPTASPTPEVDRIARDQG